MRIEEVGSATILQGDAVESMRLLIAEGVKVQCCVTSPPYFGLRDYGHPGQLGLEKTPAEYVAAMVEVFALVRELLSDDGVLWLNLGDSYTANRSYQVPSTKGGPKHSESQSAGGKGSKVPDGMRPKNLLGIPWRVALALQEGGWNLRQDIIWHKPNPMPESVTDRCTKAHEYLFLLSKSERYYWNADSMKEPAAPFSLKRWAQDVDSQQGSSRVPGKTNGNMKAVGGPRSKRDSFKREGSKRAKVMPGQSVGTHRPDRNESDYPIERRNKRSVWTVATRPFKGAHFAVFPPALVEPCILAGSRPGDIVLDPFGGSGTTGMVAQQHGRQSILLELNPEYVDLAVSRIAENKI